MDVRQGNGVGPEIWAIISTVFFDIIRKNGYGALLTASFTCCKLDISGFRFINNTDLIQTGLSCNEYWNIATKLQSTVELQEKCAEVSEGYLVPAKSWQTLVYFTWHDGKWEYRNDMDDVATNIRNADGRGTEF